MASKTRQQPVRSRPARSPALLAGMLLWASAGCALAKPPAYSSGGTLTLDRALDIALHKNRTLENAAMEVDKAADSVAAEKTRRLPRLDLRLSESYNLTPLSYTYEAGTFGTVPPKDVKIESQDDFTTVVTASIKQPLSELYRINLSIDQQEIMEDITDQQLRARRQSVTRDVKKAYYDILKSQNSLASTEESIVFYRELDELVRRYLEEQTVLEYQVMEVDSRLARSEHQAFRERNQLATQQERLNKLLGRDVTERYSVSPVGVSSVPVPAQPVAEEIAMEQRPEISEAKLKLQHAMYGYRIKKSEYFPDVDLQYRYTRFYDTEFIPDKESAIGITAYWEFYDWGRKSQDLSKKNYAIRQARNEIREAQSQVLIDVNDGLRQLEDAQNLVAVTRLTQAAAREKLRVLMNQYRVQAVLLDDVLQAESELSDANKEHNNALLSVWTSQAELQKAMGEE